MSQHVHGPFYSKCSLGNAKTSERATDGIVSVNTTAFNKAIWNPVRSPRVLHGQGKDYSTEMVVGTSIQSDISLKKMQ